LAARTVVRRGAIYRAVRYVARSYIRAKAPAPYSPGLGRCISLLESRSLVSSVPFACVTVRSRRSSSAFSIFRRSSAKATNSSNVNSRIQVGAGPVRRRAEFVNQLEGLLVRLVARALGQLESRRVRMRHLAACPKGYAVVTRASARGPVSLPLGTRSEAASGGVGLRASRRQVPVGAGDPYPIPAEGVPEVLVSSDVPTRALDRAEIASGAPQQLNTA
jgi:hypothetical protein